MAETPIRELFLRGVWRSVIPDANPQAVERMARTDGHDGPLGDQGPLVRSMLDRGVEAVDIARLSRIAAYEAVFGLLYHLDDPQASYDSFPPEDRNRHWSIFEVDTETGSALEPMPGLYEDLLGSDPTGREMRPGAA